MLSAESIKGLRDRDSEGWSNAGGSPPTALKPRGGGSVTSGAVAAGDAPLKGEKPKGGTGRTHRFGGAAATDFRGDESPGGGRGSAAHARRNRLSQHQAGRTGRKARTMPRKGKPSKGAIPGAFRSEIRSRGCGRKKASRGAKPRRRSVPGRGKPGKVASRFRKR
jgi:hypothetical protein